jgi:N-acetylmuramic acid 6-phosphate etherase
MSTTESYSRYTNLDSISTFQILNIINSEDKTVPYVIEKSLDKIKFLVDSIFKRMKDGGRLFYIGAGTPGRLGIVDASECPPTYGVDSNVVIGIIAGGDKAIRNSVEGAEDDISQAWKDLKQYNISSKDSVIGISASGRTPYVIGGIKACNKNNILTGSIVCNVGSSLAKNSNIAVEVVVGPEVVTGSTRMKSGTAQKLILNMISTSLMIKLGKVKGNKMVDMQLSNTKLIDRGVRFVSDELGISYSEAKKRLEKYKSVRGAIDSYEQKRP